MDWIASSAMPPRNGGPDKLKAGAFSGKLGRLKLHPVRDFMPRILAIAAAATLITAAVASAADTEMLPLKPPGGFKVVSEAGTDKERTVALVPNKESEAEWSERIVVRTLYKQAEQTPAAFRQAFEKAAAADCPEATFAELKHATENLYPTVMWSQRCPQAKATGKPEFTWSKAVQGRENFYLLSRTARAEPTAKQAAAWVKFFDASRVCDSRVPGQSCKPK